MVHTGVKSAGRERKITHFPLWSSGNLNGPWVVSASNAGAFSPINGKLAASLQPVRNSSFPVRQIPPTVSKEGGSQMQRYPGRAGSSACRAPV